jgi:hypothetical protein
MPVYLVIEQREGDELVGYAKYDITEPLDETSLIPLSENTVLEISWIGDLAYYRRRSVIDAPFLEPIAHLEPTKPLQ